MEVNQNNNELNYTEENTNNINLALNENVNPIQTDTEFNDNEENNNENNKLKTSNLEEFNENLVMENNDCDDKKYSDKIYSEIQKMWKNKSFTKKINDNIELNEVDIEDFNEKEIPKLLEIFSISSLFFVLICFILNIIYYYASKSNFLLGFNYYQNYYKSISNLDPLIMHKVSLIIIVFAVFICGYLLPLLWFYLIEKKQFLRVFGYSELIKLGISHYLLSVVILIFTFTDNSTIISLTCFIILFFSNIVNFSIHIKIRKNTYDKFYMAFILRGYYPAFLSINGYFTFSNVLKAIMISSFESANIAGSVIFTLLFLYSTSVMKDSNFSIIPSIILLALIIFSSVNYSITKYSYKDLICYCIMFCFLILGLMINIFKIGFYSFGYVNNKFEFNIKEELLKNDEGSQSNESFDKPVLVHNL